MYEHLEPSSMAEGDAEWELRFCPTQECTLDRLYVQRHEQHPDVWRVTNDVEFVGWLVAAIAPVCPYCGGNLLTAANILEGVDGVHVHL